MKKHGLLSFMLTMVFAFSINASAYATSEDVPSALTQVDVVENVIASSNAQQTASLAQNYNEYDYILTLRKSTDSQLSDKGLSRQTVDRMTMLFAEALATRASLPDKQLRGMGYTETEIELLRSYARGEELSDAEIRAITATCSGYFEVEFVEEKSARFSYKWWWDRCPIMLNTDAFAMRWVVFDSEGEEIGVQQVDSIHWVDYFGQGSGTSGDGAKMTGRPGDREPNLDFNTISVQFSLELAHTSGNGIIFDCYGKEGYITVEVELPAGVSSDIHHIFVSGLYGHTTMGLGSPTVNIGADGVGISFSVVGVLDPVAARQATIDSDGNIDYWDE